MCYERALELFAGLCATERDLVTERQVCEALTACVEAGVPSTHMYQWAGGYFVVRRMFVFTKRTDLRQFLWYIDRHCELTGHRQGESPMTPASWDPEARWFADPFYEWGATFVDDLYEHARSCGWLEAAHADPSQTA